jgi:O-antigen/teichoic acid export membrane protein
LAHRLVKHFAIHTTGNIIARGLNFIIQVTIWSNLFPPSVYGQVAYCFVFISFMAVILPFGFDAAFMNYYVRKKEKSAYLSNSLFFIIIISSIFIATALIFRNSLSHLAIRSDSSQLFILSLAILFFDILNNQGILFLRAENRAGMCAIIQNIEIVIRLILLLLLVNVFSKSIEYILWANVISSTVLFSVLLVLVLPKLKGGKISFGIIKELFLFSIPFMISGLFDRTIELADRRLVGHYLGDEAVGLYVASYTVAVLIRLVVYSFNAGWQPYFLKEVDEPGGRERLERIHIQTGVIFIALWFLASLWLPELVKIPIGKNHYILHKAYWDGIQIIPVIMGAYVMMGLYFLQLPVLYFFKKTILNPVFMGAGALLNVLLNILLIPKIGLMGAAIATLVSYTSMVVGIRIWSMHKLDLKQQTLKQLFVLFISLAAYVPFEIWQIPVWVKIPVAVLYAALILLIQPVNVRELIKRPNE